MTEVSNLISLTGPLLTFGSIGFGIAVYLYKNDQIGSIAYNGIILFAGFTILTALLAVCGFALDVFNFNFNVNSSNILSGLLVVSGICGFVAALIAAAGIVWKSFKSWKSND